MKIIRREEAQHPCVTPPKLTGDANTGAKKEVMAAPLAAFREKTVDNAAL